MAIRSPQRQPAACERAVLDSCVLASNALRRLFAGCATAGLLDPVWTDEIHAEWIDACRRRFPAHAGRFEEVRALLDCAVPTARIEVPPEVLARARSAANWPDPRDAHIVATALHGGASVIVTLNLADFPPACLKLAAAGALRLPQLRSEHPDAFLTALSRRQPRLMHGVVTRIHASLRDPPLGWAEFSATYERAGIPGFAKWIARRPGGNLEGEAEVSP